MLTKTNKSGFEIITEKIQRSFNPLGAGINRL